MPIITENALERHVGEPAFHTSQKDKTRVIGTLMRAGCDDHKQELKDQRRILTGDMIELVGCGIGPPKLRGELIKYQIRLKDKDLFYVMINHSPDLNQAQKPKKLKQYHKLGQKPDVRTTYQDRLL